MTPPAPYKSVAGDAPCRRARSTSLPLPLPRFSLGATLGHHRRRRLQRPMPGHSCSRDRRAPTPMVWGCMEIRPCAGGCFFYRNPRWGACVVPTVVRSWADWRDELFLFFSEKSCSIPPVHVLLSRFSTIYNARRNLVVCETAAR